MFFLITSKIAVYIENLLEIFYYIFVICEMESGMESDNNDKARYVHYSTTGPFQEQALQIAGALVKKSHIWTAYRQFAIIKPIVCLFFPVNKNNKYKIKKVWGKKLLGIVCICSWIFQ